MSNTIVGSTSSIFWPDFVFPPINLYNAPKQWIRYPKGKKRTIERSEPVIITEQSIRASITCLRER